MSDSYSPFGTWLWRVGVTLMLLFIAWVNIAPLDAPEWWFNGMGHAVAVATLCLFGGIFASAWEVHANAE